MKRKVIIFDLDGVLFDSVQLVNDFMLQSYPSMTQEVMNEILSGNFHEEMKKFKLTNKPLPETEEEKLHRRANFSLRKSQTPVYTGILELVKKLHSDGFILTVNTSAMEKNCLPLLEMAGIITFFDFVAAKEISRSKVEKFEIIKKKYGVSDEEMLFITDTLGDLREADIAHVPTVAVTWGAHDRSFFTREPHENLVSIVDSVDELSSIINK